MDVVGETGSGIFQLAVDTERAESDDLDLPSSSGTNSSELAIATRVPTTYGLRRQHLRAQLDTFDAAAGGGLMFGQCQSASEAVWSFATLMPFDNDAAWRPVRALPIDEQAAILSDPDRQAAMLITATEAGKDSGALYDKLIPMERRAQDRRGDRCVPGPQCTRGTDPMCPRNWDDHALLPCQGILNGKRTCSWRCATHGR